ncbi:MAG TPA: glycosyltransferase family 87 protein [Pirellulaceae bacterium]|jgi:hypothetical protein
MGQRKRLSNAAAALLFIAALVSVGSRCWLEQRPAENPHHPTRSAFCDFQDVVYYPARAAFAGINPYDPRPAEEGGQYFARYPAGNSFPLYAPAIFVASLPLAVLDLTAAEILYWIFNVGLLAFYGYVLLRICEQRVTTSSVMALATVLLVCRPGNANLYFGNVALPMALATVGSWWLAERRPWISGLLLAVACIKPTFGGPLFVLLLLRGSYRAALTGFGIAVIANVAVVAALLPQLMDPNHLLEMLAANQTVTELNEGVDPLVSASRVDFLMVIERLVGQHLQNVLRYALTFALLIVAGLAVRRLKRSANGDGSGTELNSLAIASLTITLCIYHNIYDALLIAPAALAAFVNLSKSQSDRRRGGEWLLLALLLVPAVNYFTSAKFLTFVAETMPPLATSVQQPAVWTMLCILNGACLMIAWIILLIRCFHASKAATV